MKTEEWRGVWTTDEPSMFIAGTKVSAIADCIRDFIARRDELKDIPDYDDHLMKMVWELLDRIDRVEWAVADLALAVSGK